MKASKAIDSVKAKPIRPTGNKSFFAEGLREIDEISVENIWPRAKPTPKRASVAIPAPIIFAETGSIFFSLSKRTNANLAHH